MARPGFQIQTENTKRDQCAPLAGQQPVHAEPPPPSGRRGWGRAGHRGEFVTARTKDWSAEWGRSDLHGWQMGELGALSPARPPELRAHQARGPAFSSWPSRASPGSPHPTSSLRSGPLCLWLVSEPRLMNQAQPGHAHPALSPASQTWCVHGGFVGLPAHAQCPPAFSAAANQTCQVRQADPGTLSSASAFPAPTRPKPSRCCSQNPPAPLSVSTVTVLDRVMVTSQRGDRDSHTGLLTPAPSPPTAQASAPETWKGVR